MKENLLQFIWQFQYFNKGDLLTVAGEQIQIINPGNINHDQGPDFLNAKIKINETLWAGNIELHINASDWELHKHSTDSNYQNIILHVVFNNDKEISQPFPVLELKNRISNILLDRYKKLMEHNPNIACSEHIDSINELTFSSWKERLLVERLQTKSKAILEKASETNFHWEEIFWQIIARNFGIKTNADAFENIARTLPVTLFAKHKTNLLQIEAILFGQAKFLNKITDEYQQTLKKEYDFLKNKYQLSQPEIPVFFLRMRPANFPTIRLAQLAMLLHQSLHLFSKIIEENDLRVIKKMLDVTASSYWDQHYKFGEGTIESKKHLGKQMILNIVINSVVPMLFAYGQYHKKQALKDKAVAWLQEIEAEKNTVTKVFTNLNFKNKTAFDSQAFIQLKNEYCDKKRCLNCAVGNKILKA